MNALELLEPGTRGVNAPECPYLPLLGSWDITSVWYLPDGRTRDAKGEWHFAMILGGLGVQDVLFEKDAPAERRGTTLRYYDSAEGTWRVCWMAPGGGEFVTLTAWMKGDRIVQEGVTLDGNSRQRWTFSDISDDAFVWQAEGSVDGGSTWRLDQEMRARRVS